MSAASAARTFTHLLSLGVHVRSMQKPASAVPIVVSSAACPPAGQTPTTSTWASEDAGFLGGAHPPSSQDSLPADGPGPLALGFGFVLTGIGTVLLGPLLPELSTAWHLTDANSGVLLAAKFSGAFLGGFGVLRRLRLSLLLGAVLCATGFGLFGLAGGLLQGALALFVGGLGLGQIIASTNILVGRRYAPRSAPALSMLNFFWSLGAVLTGLLVASLLPHFGFRNLVVAFAILFLLVALPNLRHWTNSAGPAHLSPAEAPSHRLSRPEFLHFAALLLLYGGLETALSGWLTTYTLRFSNARYLDGQSAIVLFWTALTLGRIVASGLMKRFRETHVRAGGLALALFSIGCLMASSQGVAQLCCCVLLGLGLAPFFPATFARLMRHQPRERIAGLILAVSGVGAAIFPWMIGVMSEHTGSLRLAMTVTLGLTLMLLVVSAFEPHSVSET